LLVVEMRRLRFLYGRGSRVAVDKACRLGRWHLARVCIVLIRPKCCGFLDSRLFLIRVSRMRCIPCACFRCNRIINQRCWCRASDTTIRATVHQPGTSNTGACGGSSSRRSARVAPLPPPRIRACLDESTKPCHHVRCPLSLGLCSHCFQMRHDCPGHVSQEHQIFVGYAVPRFIIQDAIGSDVDARRSSDRYTRIKTSVWKPSYKWSVQGLWVLGEVVDDKDTVTFTVHSRARRAKRRQVHSDLAARNIPRNSRMTQPKLIIHIMGIVVFKRK